MLVINCHLVLHHYWQKSVTKSSNFTEDSLLLYKLWIAFYISRQCFMIRVYKITYFCLYNQIIDQRINKKVFMAFMSLMANHIYTAYVPVGPLGCITLGDIGLLSWMILSPIYILYILSKVGTSGKWNNNLFP